MDDITLLLKKASKVVKCDFNERLKEHGLTQPQWDVLKELYNCKIDCRENTANKLAKRLKSDKPTMSGIIHRLILGEWVTRRVNAMDARSQFIDITDKARQIVDKGEKCSRDSVKKALKGLSDADVKKLTKTLNVIIENMED